MLNKRILEIDKECEQSEDVDYRKTIGITGGNIKSTNKPTRTYLCPVSDCVFICPTLQDAEAAQHLQSCHGDSDYTVNKFIKL